MTDHQPARSTGVSAQTILVLLAVALIPLIVIYHSASDAEAMRKSWRADCLAPEKEKTDVFGLVRERQGGFYLEVSPSLYYLGKACDGKNARACLDANPGKGRLAANVGQPASARLCDGEVLSYRVAGSAFYK